MKNIQKKILLSMYIRCINSMLKHEAYLGLTGKQTSQLQSMLAKFEMRRKKLCSR